MRLVIVLLAANVGRLQFPFSGYIIFVVPLTDFAVIFIVRCYGCVKDVEVNSRKLFGQKGFQLTQFFWNMLKFFIVFLDGATKESFMYWWNIFIGNIWQFKDQKFHRHKFFEKMLRKSMSSLSLFCLYFSFSYFWKSLIITFPYFCVLSLYIFIIFLDSTKLKLFGEK